MLTYTSHPLEQALTVIGPVKAVLYAASSAPDTDWVVRLCDVWPDGRSMSVCDGILRARYRESLTQPTLLHPGEVYRFEIDLQATAQVFQVGHCLRVEVTSSDFPRYDRNLHTGAAFGTGTQGEVAYNTDLLRRVESVSSPLADSSTVEEWHSDASSYDPGHETVRSISPAWLLNEPLRLQA